MDIEHHDLSDQDLDDIVPSLTVAQPEAVSFVTITHAQFDQILSRIHDGETRVLQLQACVKRLNDFMQQTAGTLARIEQRVSGEQYAQPRIESFINSTPGAPELPLPSKEHVRPPNPLQDATLQLDRSQPFRASAAKTGVSVGGYSTTEMGQHGSPSSVTDSATSHVLGRPAKRKRKNTTRTPSPTPPQHSALTPVLSSVWPEPGPITLEGKEMLECQSCEEWVHRSCAGVPLDTDMGKETYFCPVCSHDPVSRPRRRGGRSKMNSLCLRKPCSFLNVTFAEKPGAQGVEFFMEKLLGRRAFVRDEAGIRHFEYLVKWEGYPISEATWEKPENISAVGPARARFESTADELGINLRARCALLPEALSFWDEKGVLKAP